MASLGTTPPEILLLIRSVSYPLTYSSSSISIVRSCASHGVNHCDLNPGNILFSSQQPSRVVVIDFSESFLRRDKKSDSGWQSIVESQGSEIVIQLSPRSIPVPMVPNAGMGYVEREGKR